MTRSLLNCFAVSLFGLSVINLCLPLPAKAALACKKDTINRYQDGSVESCALDTDTDIQTGTFAFSCLQGNSISFDEKAHFRSCSLSIPVKIRKGNSVETCLEKSKVYVSISSNNEQSVSCSNVQY
jgi:hypothetical protein